MTDKVQTKFRVRKLDGTKFTDPHGVETDDWYFDTEAEARAAARPEDELTRVPGDLGTPESSQDQSA